MSTWTLRVTAQTFKHRTRSLASGAPGAPRGSGSTGQPRFGRAVGSKGLGLLSIGADFLMAGHSLDTPLEWVWVNALVKEPVAFLRPVPRAPQGMSFRQFLARRYPCTLSLLCKQEPGVMEDGKLSTKNPLKNRKPGQQASRG